MSASRYIIVTASDDTYLPLALDLLRSLRRLKSSISFSIGILDLGLSDEAKAKLSAFDVIIKSANIDIEYPARAAWEKQAPYYRAMTARPYLRDYFPGFNAYMWMDADTWAQNDAAITTMLPAAASDQAVYVVSEIDRDYMPYFYGSQPWEYHLKWYKANFPDEITAQIFPRPMLNTGILALAPNSPVWSTWGETFTQCLQRLPQLGRENFMSEQLSLNVALHMNSLPYKIMPAEFNWLSLYALPMVDEATGNYLRPTVPRTELSVIHITHQQKLRELDLMTTAGQTIKRVLTFSDYERGLS
ncbi:MAG: glycosyltransferase [Alphaproteobacteria bacterium]